MRILITGGTGFIGSNLARRCIERGDEVRILAQENTDAEKSNLDKVREYGAEVTLGSITEKAELAAALKGVDVVYHLAAAQHEMDKGDSHFYEVNVQGTKNLLEASKKAGVKRFLHGSTIGVYGYLDGKITEDSPCNPDNIYGKSKYDGEKAVLEFKEQLPVTVIRIPEVYGPGDRRLLKLFKMARKGRFPLSGSGKNLHHLIYIDDLIDGFFQAVESEKSKGEVYLLAGKEAVDTNDMVKIVGDAVGNSSPCIKIPMFLLYSIATCLEFMLRPLGKQPPIHRRSLGFYLKGFELSREKAGKAFGFKPPTSFVDGAQKTAIWYEKEGLLGGFPALNEARKIESRLDWREIDSEDLSSRMEPFDSFWEAPSDIEKGYRSFDLFYTHNYMPYFPKNKDAKILDISCGPGYLLKILQDAGYTNMIGIDSFEEKVAYSQKKGLPAVHARSFEYLRDSEDASWDLIFCEQEINHLNKEEILAFLTLCRIKLKAGGQIIFHALSGANSYVGAENLAHNIDHQNTLTEYSMWQILATTGFVRIKPFPLYLYVLRDKFSMRMIMTILSIAEKFNNLFFTFQYRLYGKNNKIFTKKIGASAYKEE